MNSVARCNVNKKLSDFCCQKHYFFIPISILLLFLHQIQGHIEVIKIITRIPKPKDIGLIFDVTLKNSNEEVEELLKYRIRANGYCCVNADTEIVIERMGTIIGGDFGLISPGAIHKVSLIWPTENLFNRVGLCPIIITSINADNEERYIKQLIKFDTRFEILNPEIGFLLKPNNSLNCQNIDKDHFHNVTSEKCEEVPQCTEKYKLYYIYNQKCVDIKMLCTHQSRFNNILETGSKNHLKPPVNNKNNFPSWLKGLGGGLLIVFATITIYLLICFGLFLIVIWLTRRSNTELNSRGSGMILTPHHLGSSEENIPLYTTSSLMSQR